jgi:fumarylacetoacetate (FAA) hydrolase
MKLASYDDGSRDGHLVVVSRDLRTAHFASGIATRLQQVLDDWAFMAPQLEELSITLNHGKARHAFPFEPARCLAPLPRCTHWVSAQAWPAPEVQPAHASGAANAANAIDAASATHAAGASSAANLPSPAGPELRRGAGDALFGPHTRLYLPEGRALDCEAQWLMLTDGVPQACTSGDALERVRLLGLAATWWLRSVQHASAAQGLAGPSELHAWPASSFSPVLATPDELGDAWRAGRLRRPLAMQVRGQALGPCEAGQGMTWHGGQVLAWLARQQSLGAGTMVGMGPVRPSAARPGACCLQDARRHAAQGEQGEAVPEPVQKPTQAPAPEPVQAQSQASAQAPTHKPSPSPDLLAWLAPGDRVHIDMQDAQGQSLFGAIDVTLESLHDLESVATTAALPA